MPFQTSSAERLGLLPLPYEVSRTLLLLIASGPQWKAAPSGWATQCPENDRRAESVFVDRPPSQPPAVSILDSVATTTEAGES